MSDAAAFDAFVRQRERQLQRAAWLLTGDWAAAEASLAEAKRLRATDGQALDAAREATVIGLLTSTADDSQKTVATWRKLAPEERFRPAIAIAAARACLTAKAPDAARDILEQLLERGWNSEAVQVYGDAVGRDVIAMIARCEEWLRAQPRDAALLLVLGKLCARQELRGKARGYLEASLALAGEGPVADQAAAALAELTKAA